MPRAKVVGEVILWWAASFGVWLVSLSAVPLQEMLVASAASLPCGVAAVGARRAVGDRWTVRAGWYRPVFLLPLTIVSNAGQVLWAAARRRSGYFETVPTGAGGEGVEPRSRRALAAAMVSVSPGAYVVDVEAGSGDMFVHLLGKGGPPVSASLPPASSRTG